MTTTTVDSDGDPRTVKPTQSFGSRNERAAGTLAEASAPAVGATQWANAGSAAVAS